MMALLGMGANVQCNGTVPGYHSGRDLIFGSEDSTRNLSNNNIEIPNDCCSNGSLPVSSPAHHVENNKELVKQTILKHEAMFKEQIFELHRLYNRQKELMDEVKRSFDRHSSVGTSFPSSFPSHVPSITPNLPWSTGQSSAIVAENIQMSLRSGKENSWQIHPNPALFPTEGCSRDFKLSHSENRKVGNKLLDLHLPADEYIGSEKAMSLEDERGSKLPRISAYTLEGVSQAVSNRDKRPYGANFNGFSNLNKPLEHMKDANLKSDDLMGPTSHRKGPFHDLSVKREMCFQNMPDDAFWNPYQRQGHEVRVDNQPLEKKNQEQLFYMISADEMNQGLWRERQFPGGESSVGTTKGPMGASLLGPISDPYQLVSGSDGISSRIHPLLKIPGFNTVENQTTVQARPYFSASAMFDQRSQPLTGSPGPTGDELDRCGSGNIKSGVHFDGQNFLQSSFCGGSQTSDAPSFLANNPNGFTNQSSPTSHELREHVKDSEDVETSNNINLNVMPSANNSEVAAFQNVKEDLLLNGKPCGENKISTRMESFRFEPCDSGITRDCNRKKTPASNINVESETSSVCQDKTKNEKIEEIEKGCVSDIELPRNPLPGLGDQIAAGDKLTKNEQGRELKCGAGIIDLNISMNEDENMPVDIDFQAPVSPENKESSPPRGESDENQLEVPYQLAGQECSKLQLEEEAKLAAEALVSISESTAPSGLQMITCLPSESFTSNPLHWFARIASSVTDNPGNDIKADFTDNTSDHEEFLPDGIDYFEAMTLKLTETKSPNFCGKSGGQKEEEGGSTNSPTRPRKGWTVKGKRPKDFQNEILPSLSSLSRYEVTEDLQTIGGLMEAGGAHSGRNALARGRKRSSASVSNNTFLLKQQINSGVNKLGIEKRGLMNWGKASRKPRGKRYPARNPQILWRQVSFK